MGSPNPCSDQWSGFAWPFGLAPTKAETMDKPRILAEDAFGAVLGSTSVKGTTGGSD